MGQAACTGNVPEEGEDTDASHELATNDRIA